MDAIFLSAKSSYKGNQWAQELEKDWVLLRNFSAKVQRDGGNMLPHWKELKALYEKKYATMPDVITWNKPVHNSKVHKDPKLDGDFKEDGRAHPIHFKNQLVRIPLFEEKATPRKVLQVALNAGQASILFKNIPLDMMTYVSLTPVWEDVKGPWGDEPNEFFDKLESDEEEIEVVYTKDDFLFDQLERIAYYVHQQRILEVFAGHY
jgi:hypothetical protein